MNNLNIAQLINSGAYDADLDAIETAVKIRRKSQIHTLQIKQEVWFTKSVNPKYLAGVRCIVEDVNRERIVVRVADPAYSGRFRNKIHVPLTIITHIKPSYAIG